MTGSIGTRYQGPSFRTHEQSLLLEQRKESEQKVAIGSRPSHLNVVLSKAALSGPSVCLRARAPCPLRASCFGADSAESYVLLHSVRLQRIVPSSGSGVPVHPPPRSRGRAARAAGLRSGGSLGQDRALLLSTFSWILWRAAVILSWVLVVGLSSQTV